LEKAILNEALQTVLDSKGKESLQKMSFKWLNERVTTIENTINGGNI
jgi:hypothetical protein